MNWRARETIFTRNATEALNLVAYSWGRRTSAPATGSSSPRWSTTRTSCRGSCSASGPARRSTGSRRRRRAPRPRRARREARRRRREARRRRARLERRSGRSTLSPRSPRRAHAAGAVVVVDGSQAVPQMPGRPRARSTPTSTPGPGTRPTGRPASASCTAATSCSTTMPPFLGGGHMIASVALRRARRWAEVPGEVRGRHDADRRGDRPRRRRRLPVADRDGRGPRARARPRRPTRSSGSPPVAGPARPRPARRRATAARSSRSRSTASTRTTSPRSSAAGRLHPRRPPLRPAAHEAPRRRRRRRARRSRCTTRARTSTA